MFKSGFGMVAAKQMAYHKVHQRNTCHPIQYAHYGSINLIKNVMINDLHFIDFIPIGVTVLVVFFFCFHLVGFLYITAGGCYVSNHNISLASNCIATMIWLCAP